MDEQMQKEKTIEEMTFEEAMAALENIVRKLEGGSAPLEELLQYYETGSKLMRRCNKLLEDAKQRVYLVENGEEQDFPPMKEQ